MYINSSDRIVILMHGGLCSQAGKTGNAILRFSESAIVGVIDRHVGSDRSLKDLTGIDRDIPILKDFSEAVALNPTKLLIGVAPPGGRMPEELRADIQAAIAEGLDIVSGLHTKISEEFTSKHPEQKILDVRQEPKYLNVATGKARELNCRRILTVGTDMSVGKMSAGLVLTKALNARNIVSRFVATGQGGIMISGGGVALDAVRVDYAAGAVEWAVQSMADECDVLVVEGQGSLLHPGSTAPLPLIRGSQPHGMVLVHRAGQMHIKKMPEFPIPPLTEVINLYENLAAACSSGFQPSKVCAVALNTHHISDDREAKKEIEKVANETGLPCNDVVRFGAENLIEAVMEA